MVLRSPGRTRSNSLIIAADSLPIAPFARPAGAVSTNKRPPNKRLKLAGGDRLKGSGVLCPGGHGLSSTTLAPAGESPAA